MSTLRNNRNENMRQYASYRYNGIDRVDSKIGYVEGNIVPCCEKCNFMKSNLEVDVFLEHVHKIENYSSRRRIKSA